MSEAGIEIPGEIENAIDLTEYAVETRYPGEREPVTGEEYKEGLKLAEIIYNWVIKIIMEAEKR